MERYAYSFYLFVREASWKLERNAGPLRMLPHGVPWMLLFELIFIAYVAVKTRF